MPKVIEGDHVGTFLVRYKYDPDHFTHSSIWLQNPSTTYKIIGRDLPPSDVHDQLDKVKLVDLYNPITVESGSTADDNNRVNERANASSNEPLLVTVRGVNYDDCSDHDPLGNDCKESCILSHSRKEHYIMNNHKNMHGAVTLRDTLSSTLRYIGMHVSYMDERTNAIMMIALYSPHSESFLRNYARDIFQSDGKNYIHYKRSLQVVDVNRTQWYYLINTFTKTSVGRTIPFNMVLKKMMMEVLQVSTPPEGVYITDYSIVAFMLTMLQSNRSTLLPGCFDYPMYNHSMEHRMKVFVNQLRPEQYHGLYMDIF